MGVLIPLRALPSISHCNTLLAKNFGRFQFRTKNVFKRQKILRPYSKTTLVSRNKPDVIRRGLEMAGIVKAVTKELEPEVPFRILVVNHFEFQSSYMEQTLGETLLEMSKCLTEFVFFFSHLYICKP